MTSQYELNIKTHGRGLIDITARIIDFVTMSEVVTGLCHLFIQHTSASLIINENADPLVQKDLELFMHRLVPDGDAIYTHIAEGEDDMASHIRSVLTQTEITLPVRKGELALGTWQGIYLWEHRLKSHDRNIIVTLI